MAHISYDKEAKVLARIKMLLEGEMKERLMDTFLQTMAKNHLIKNFGFPQIFKYFDG